MAPYEQAPHHVDLAGHLHGRALEKRHEKNHLAAVRLDDQLASIAWEEVWFVIGAWFVAGLLLALP